MTDLVRARQVVSPAVTAAVGRHPVPEIDTPRTLTHLGVNEPSTLEFFSRPGSKHDTFSRTQFLPNTVRFLATFKVKLALLI